MSDGKGSALRSTSQAPAIEGDNPELAHAPYDPRDHIERLDIPPRPEAALEQDEITIHSYRTSIPFDLDALNRKIEAAWLTPQSRLGVCARTPLGGTDALHVVLGLQDEISVRAYDYDDRRSLWYSWQHLIVEVANIHYFRDDNGLLRFKTMGGGRRITEERLYDFNSAFLGVPKDAVRKHEFDLAKLRELCFNRFADRLYMLVFADPSDEGYRGIEDAKFHSRTYLDPHAERLNEIRSDPTVRIESFESDILIRSIDLNAPVQVRFEIRGLNGSLRLKFPKISYRKEPKSTKDQAVLFSRLVFCVENSILDADYYAWLPRSLDELDVELGMFIDAVDLTPFREVLLDASARSAFFERLDPEAPWNLWQPHLRAISELLPARGVQAHVSQLVEDLVASDSIRAASLLRACDKDAKLHQVGHLTASALAAHLQEVSADIRQHIEHVVLSWAVNQEADTWDVEPSTQEIVAFDLRWQLADLQLDILPAVLWKLVGLLHARLMATESDIGELLDSFDWCVAAAKQLPPNHSKVPMALRLLANGKAPTVLAEGRKLLTTRLNNWDDLDNALFNKWGLPLWPCLSATISNGTAVLVNSGIGVARSLRAVPQGSLFESAGVTDLDLGPNDEVEVAVETGVRKLLVEFSKFGKAHRVEVPIVPARRRIAASPATVQAAVNDHFGWAQQVELVLATQRVLGKEEAPNKGTISRAIQDGLLDSNGKSRHACRIRVDSVKGWLTKHWGLDHEEAQQVLDAIITEIRRRKPSRNKSA